MGGRSAGARTPYFLLDEEKLLRNLEILKEVSDRAGCKILLAQKAFSMFSVYPLIRKYLAGTAASGLYEARLGAEEFGGETHVFSPAYRQEEFEEILTYADDIVFNSPDQVRRYGRRAKEAGKAVGLRINPECSTQEGHAIYDPCAPFSRLGTTEEKFRSGMTEEDIASLDGLHFHTLCEQNADDLAKTLDAVEERFGDVLHRMKWLNFGGGHHITRKDYQIPLLIRCIRRIKERYGLQVYLEPGEAVALNAGYLLTRVLDVVENGGVSIAILDTSAACHMPDVLEMPYRPPLKDSGMPGEKAYTFRLAGPTCLAGDVIGDYSFDEPLKVGQELVFQDMAIYSMVKNNTFNGMPLPAIAFMRQGECRIWKRFGYEDFKCRL